MKSILIKDTTREERERIVHQALWGACGIDEVIHRGDRTAIDNDSMDRIIKLLR
jgi:hypothetical protein